MLQTFINVTEIILIVLASILTYATIAITYAKVRGPLDKKNCLKKGHTILRDYEGNVTSKRCGYERNHNEDYHDEIAMFQSIVWPFVITYKIIWAMIVLLSKGPIGVGNYVAEKISVNTDREKKIEEEKKNRDELANRIAEPEKRLGII